MHVFGHMNKGFHITHVRCFQSNEKTIHVSKTRFYKINFKTKTFRLQIPLDRIQDPNNQKLPRVLATEALKLQCLGNIYLNPTRIHMHTSCMVKKKGNQKRTKKRIKRLQPLQSNFLDVKPKKKTPKERVSQSTTSQKHQRMLVPSF